MKQFKFYALMLGMAVGAGFLASCGDDDDDFGPASNEIGALSSGTSADEDLPKGYRLVSVESDDWYSGSEFEAKYDRNGKLVAISDGDDTYEVTSNPFTISHSESDYDGKWEETYKLSLNKSGYVSKIEASYNYRSSESQEKATGTMTFSYNGDGRLASVKFTSSGYEYEDGEKINFNYKDEYALSYQSGKLAKVTNKWEEKDDHLHKGEGLYEYEYDENYKNTFNQYTPGLLYWLDLDLAGDFLGYLGLMGKASSKLPTGVYHSEKEYCSEEGEWEEYDNSQTFGPYSFNGYGAIQTADGYRYYYDSVTSTRSAKGGAKSSLAKGLRKMVFKHCNLK